MSPVGTALNVLAAHNEMPTYERYWEPFGITPASASAVVFPDRRRGRGALVPGALLSFPPRPAWARTPPLGFGCARRTRGRLGQLGQTPTSPGQLDTVATVDLCAVSATTFLAGVLRRGRSGRAMPGRPQHRRRCPARVSWPWSVVGFMQVLVDNTTTIGHTLEASTTSGPHRPGP